MTLESTVFLGVFYRLGHVELAACDAVGVVRVSCGAGGCLPVLAAFGATSLVSEQNFERVVYHMGKGAS